MSAPAFDSWKRVESVLNEALDLGAEERTAFLDHACAES